MREIIEDMEKKFDFQDNKFCFLADKVGNLCEENTKQVEKNINLFLYLEVGVVKGVDKTPKKQREVNC